jgi:dTDP-4-amino-4,6-dideoxygalactose transaminase
MRLTPLEEARMTESVPFVSLVAATQALKRDLVAAAERVFDGGMFILGEEVARFESEFALFCASRHAVGVGNGLDALTLALRAMGVGPGDEVVTPCHTFIATWLAISACGATPVPADVDAATYTLDPESLRRVATPRAKAVIAVHLYGHPADMDEINTVARERGLRVLEDAAQAHGALYKGRPVGALADSAAFSFYPTKNLGAFGDGGAVVTNDTTIERRVRRLRNYGSERKYMFEEQGVNTRLDELQAGLLRVKLTHVQAGNAARRRIAAQYLAAFSDLPLVLPTVANWADPVWHLFVVRTPDRDRLITHLAARGVMAQIHYPQLPHQQGAYCAAKPDPATVRVSEEVAREVLSLPLWPEMTDPMVEQVIAAVRSYFRSQAR